MNNIMYIIWNDKNNLGIPIIDEQHRGVISTINSLYYFIQSGQGEEILRPTMIILEQYIKIHFNTEEALLVKAKYPDIEEHFALHKQFVNKTKKFSMNTFGKKESEMVLKFLKEWWLNHINKEDRKYVPFVINK